MSKLQHSGFTLAELLIALAILGVIATFTIPKILTSQQTAQKTAIFKETLSTISAANLQGVTTGNLLRDGSNFTTYFFSAMNSVKTCASNSLTQGCWTAAMGSVGEHTQPGLIMHNGAYVVGLDSGNVGENGVVVDWNGIAGPNAMGDDQIKIDVNYGSNSPPMVGNGPKGIGSIGPFNDPDGTTNTALYQTIFQ